jgi:anhydro-N-acetylmuramic acid kinase
MIAIGLMSGTSLDGIDAALVRIEPRGTSYAFELLRFATVPFGDALYDDIRAALPPHVATAEMLASLHRELGTAFARAARAVSGGVSVDFIASHGQTMWHDGPRHLTMQLGDPFIIRESLCATVCYDFRSADCAVGGHGAPLVPYVDALLLASDVEDRVALNIGGIANLTALPAGAERNDVAAFDVGPGNMLIDAFVNEKTLGDMNFDPDGAFAARGAIDVRALTTMLEDEYFAAAPPKSTGRERFGAQFLRQHRDVLGGLSLEDGCATLTELTAASVAAAIDGCRLAGARVLVSGGGAKNPSLMDRLQARLPHASIEPSDMVGIPADAKEALAFTVLGYETLRERAANVPRVTGAARAVSLGAVAPFDFARLHAEILRECRSL